MTYKVFMPQKINQVGIDFLEKRGYEIVYGNGHTEEDLKRDIRNCDAAIIRTLEVTRAVIESADKLKIIARHGAGYDKLDIEACKENNILVVNAPGANSVSVAELTLFYMLYCSRNFKEVQDKFMEDYNYAKFSVKKHELSGKVLGLLGTGNIGKKVAKFAQALDMEVIAFDPYTKSDGSDGIKYVDREDVFKCADYVSLHMPLTKDTQHSVSDKEFNLMKNTSYIINTARGGIIDEKALIKAIEEGKIAGGALDTIEEEPISSDNPLLKVKNLLLAPHIGAATVEASNRSTMMCVEGVDDYLTGKKPKHIIKEMK